VPFPVSRSISTSMYLPGGGVSPAGALLWSSPTKIAASRSFGSDNII